MISAPRIDHGHHRLAGYPWNSELIVAAVVKPSWSSTSGGISQPTSTYPHATRNPAAGGMPRAAQVASEPAAGISRERRPMHHAQRRHATRAKTTGSGSAPPGQRTPAGVE